MEKHPLVSVLMTAYNRQDYIGEAIESVLASTYQSFELIVVDDRSKDNTVGIARSFEAKDSRVKVFLNDVNLGDYPNRNKAASYATGKYIKYVDADDRIYPWGLEILVNIMEQFNGAGWGLCSLEQYKERPFPFELNPREAYEYHYIGPGLFHKAPLSAIIKKDVFNSAGGFANIRMAGDFELWHRLAQRHNVVLMPHGIVWYREHGEQEMNDYARYIPVYNQIKINYLKDVSCPLNKGLVTLLLSRFRRTVVKRIFSDMLKFRIQSLKGYLQTLQEF